MLNVRVMAYGSEIASINGAVLNVNLVCGNTVGTYPITFAKAIVADTDAKAMEVEIHSGTIELTTTSIPETDFARAINLYPNPANKTLNIDFETDSEFTIRIFDMQGKEVAKKSNSKTIDVSSYSNGIYMLQILSNEGVATKRFVKE